MRSTSRRVTGTLAFLVVLSLIGSAASTQSTPTVRAIQLEDVIAWKTIGATALSNDGQWLAYRLAPAEGDAQVIVRSTKSDKEMKFDIGEPPQMTMPAGPGGPPPSASALDFSQDSRWVAFASYPTHTETQRLKKQRRPLQSGITIVNLATGEKREFPKIRRFAFSGDASTWIGMLRYQAQPAPAGPLAGGAPPSAGTPGGVASDRPKGSDLILRELATGQELNVGNVSEFAFTRDGRYLAWAIDAQDKAGDGITLRDMTAGTVRSLDSSASSYERITWTDKGDGLAVLKGSEDKAYKDKMYAVLGFTGLNAPAPRKATYDPAADKKFPAGMTISGDREPRWTQDLQALIFGIHELRRKDAPAEIEAGAAGAAREDADRPDGQAPDDSEKVDLVLWHWQDKRLQSQQEVQEARDRAFSYLAEYRVEPQKFIRLADDDVRNVTVAPKDRWAIGLDDREYELMGNLDGRRFQDVYAIDLKDGARKLAAKRLRWFNGASPDGSAFLFFEDGDYRVYSMDSGQVRNITEAAATSFIDADNDTNVVNAPTTPVGWVSDSKSVLLSDNWDIWRVPVAGGTAVNLTGNGRKEGIRYQSRYPIEPPDARDEGIDLTGTQYFRAYGEWTKKSGIARLEPGKDGMQVLLWSDAAFARMLKAKNTEQYVYTRETATEPTDFYATGAQFGPGTRLTDMRAQVAQFAWTSGVTLVNYTSEKGDKLQAALFLPANYEKGKSYPTVVNFYEKMSQTANTFANPSANGFNRSVYTSNGYAVLMPDIKYRVNDPGMSAVWCMVPAVKAAVATGIVDPKRIGITGHSWGGYQTAFLVTQTDVFAAAVAGAPLTNMVSMYSLIYKNTGGTNQAIFESSQGRFKGGYWDNWDAYYRNSPVFFAKNVKTPLMILHNDKDGAVDFTQGVEYFNTLRRLQKPVIMLEYTGENHGLRKPANQRDYTVRMKEFFDHYLQGAPAPDWMLKGIPRLEMEEHLKQRAKPRTPQPVKKTTTE